MQLYVVIPDTIKEGNTNQANLTWEGLKLHQTSTIKCETSLAVFYPLEGIPNTVVLSLWSVRCLPKLTFHQTHFLKLNKYVRNHNFHPNQTDLGIYLILVTRNT